MRTPDGCIPAVAHENPHHMMVGVCLAVASEGRRRQVARHAAVPPLAPFLPAFSVKVCLRAA